MTNYVASTTINFEGSRFYVRPGDILSYNPQHGGGSLAIFRNGQLVKVLRTDSLAIEAFLKSRFISEVKAPPKPPPAPAGTITLDTLIDGYSRTLRPGPPPPTYTGCSALPRQQGRCPTPTCWPMPRSCFPRQQQTRSPPTWAWLS